MKTIVAKDLFVEAMRKAPEERAAWIEGLSEDSQLELRKLLEADVLLNPQQEAATEEARFLRASSLVAGSSVSSLPPVTPRPPGTHAVTARQAAAATGIPAQIGKYRIISKLGQGAQGAVYRGVHPTLNRDVAIKLSLVPLEPGQREGLQAEADVLCHLSHPNLAQVYDLDFENGCPFLVMEHIPGQSLEQLAASGRLTAAQSIEIVRKLCVALDYVHSKGVIHQDLKPENIIIDERMEPRIIDFGLAHLRTAWAESDSQLVGGTLAYMSPEQAAGFRLPEDPLNMVAPKIDHRADIFALGAILYRLLTGRRLYDVASRDEGIRAARECVWDSELFCQDSRLNWAGPVCVRALEKDLNARFSSCTDFAAAITKSIPKDFAPKTRPPALFQMSLSHRSTGCSVALTLSLLIGLGLYWIPKIDVRKIESIPFFDSMPPESNSMPPDLESMPPYPQSMPPYPQSMPGDDDRQDQHETGDTIEPRHSPVNQVDQ